MTTAAIITAAGSGTRLGTGAPKALALAGGVPLLAHAARSAVDAGIGRLVVTAPPGHAEAVSALLAEHVPLADVRVVDGGATRQASVARALDALDASVDVVLVHDAARALAPPALFAAVEAAVRAGRGAVVPGLPVTDTVKEVGAPAPDGAAPVRATPDRSVLRAVQTPQGFRRDLLDVAHRAAAGRAAQESLAATDDAALAEALGEQVWVVPGEPLAFKVTTPQDLVLAEALLASARQGVAR